MPTTPVFAPLLGIDTLKHLTDAFDVGWLGMGATTADFERRIGEFLGSGTRPVIATNTGTSALHMALLLAGVGPGDEVICPSFNFIADHQAIVAVGAVPVLCDVCDDDLGADPKQIEALVTPRTKAILPLHFAGQPCRIDAIYEIARKRKLRVIEDATHAFGTKVGGRRIGAFGDIACFSFDPVKIITSIDGGAVVAPNAEDAARLHHLRLLGIDRDTVERYKNQRAWEYDVVGQGFRYHLTNINASIGVSQIKRADEFIASRQATCRLYNERLAGVRDVRCPETDFADESRFIYTIRVPAARREALIAHLKANDIAVGIHFQAAHRFTFCRDWPRGPMPVTERAAAEILTLPLHSNMPNELAERIAGAVASFFVTSRRAPKKTKRSRVRA